MRKQLPPTALQRDTRFNRISTEERFADERPNDVGRDRLLEPESSEAGDRARRQMHGIFVGEIQALEGAGRTAFDYTTDETPFAMKLDMARQCWDEARHVEISIRLGDHMGSEIGEWSEAVTLFEAACHRDPVFRLAGVNRALEFQRTVDGLFNFRGSRGETREHSIRLARKFREMAGFQTEEIDEIAAMSHAQRAQQPVASAR